MGGRRIWSTRVRNVEARESRDVKRLQRPRQVWRMPDGALAVKKGAKGAIACAE